MAIHKALTALSIFAAFGCGLQAPIVRMDPVYFPMEANRVWDYRLYDLGGHHAWPISVRSRGPRFVPQLKRVVAIFDEEYPDQIVPVAFFLDGGFLQSEIGLGYDRGDRMSRLPIGTEPMRLMPVPPVVGMRWAYSEGVFSGAGKLDPILAIRWTGVIHAEESVEVPAGIFRDCLRVESVAAHQVASGDETRQFRYVDWYAPGVGLVKSEYSFGDSGATLFRIELVRHRQVPQSPIPDAPNMLLVSAR